MPAGTPPTVEVDLNTWILDFHAIGSVKLDDDEQRVDPRPSKLHSGAHAVAFCIAGHWNRQKRKAWPTIETISLEAEVGTATVKRSIKALEDAGWLLVTHRPKPQSNIYRLASPLAAARAAAVDRMDHDDPLNGSSRSIEGITMIHEPKKEPQIEPEEIKNTRSTTSPMSGQPVDKSKSVGLSTAQACAWRDGEKTAKAHPIHPDWVPNSKHTTKARDLGLSVDALAEQFRAGFIESGEKRDSWGSTFTAYLRDAAAAREKTTFKGVDVDIVADVRNQQVDAEYRKLVAQQSHVESSEDPWAQSSVRAVPAAVDVVAPIQNARVRDDLDWIIRTWGALSVEGVELAVKLLSSGSPRFEVATDVEEYRESRVLVAA